MIFHSRLRDSRLLAGLRSSEIEGRVLHLLCSQLLQNTTLDILHFCAPSCTVAMQAGRLGTFHAYQRNQGSLCS
jgi:hypothetical protein